MKSSILNFLAALGLSAALSAVGLQAQGPIHVTVPFDFTVGAKSFAAPGMLPVSQIPVGEAADLRDAALGGGPGFHHLLGNVGAIGVGIVAGC